MAVTAIAQLEENRTVEGVYAVAKKQRLHTKNGAPYLALELVDPSGRISARVWNDVELLDTRFAEGDAVRVLGRVERFRDRLQLDVRTLEPARGRRSVLRWRPRCGATRTSSRASSSSSQPRSRIPACRRSSNACSTRSARRVPRASGDDRRAPLVRGRAARAHGRRRDALPRDGATPSTASPRPAARRRARARRRAYARARPRPGVPARRTKGACSVTCISVCG